MSSTPFYRRPFPRNVLYALAVLAPALYLVSGHIVLGLVFLACVMAARFSRPRPAPATR
jgi:hypothetical protein